MELVMDTFEIVMGVVLAIVAAFQVWLNVQVFKSALYDRRQKILQTQLIWLLPILGAGLVYTMLQDDLPWNKVTQTQHKS
jgi:putative copper export protein